MYDAIPLATGHFMSFYVILVTLPFSFPAADPSIIPHLPNTRVQQPARRRQWRRRRWEKVIRSSGSGGGRWLRPSGSRKRWMSLRPEIILVIPICLCHWIRQTQLPRHRPLFASGCSPGPGAPGAILAIPVLRPSSAGSSSSSCASSSSHQKWPPGGEGR